MARRPAAFLGHTFPTGAAMLDDVPWAHVLLAEMLGICWVIGAVVGVGVVLVKMRGENRARSLPRSQH